MNTSRNPHHLGAQNHDVELTIQSTGSLGGCRVASLAFLATAKTFPFALAIAFLLAAPSPAVSGDAEFKLLNEEDCKPLEPSSFTKLPPRFSAYAKWAKKCPLAKTTTSTATVFIISVWSEAYYDSQSGSAKTMRKDFPLPVIIDESFSQLGELPEIYPVNDTTFPQISFGHWVANFPTQINIDVSNPAVDGDYFYPPLVWDRKRHHYFAKPGEVKYGHRRF